MKPVSDSLFNSVVLVLYLCVVIFAMHNHELWGDEIHSWNIVKGSNSVQDLFQNIRYEGHPPFWYCYLFCFKRFSHSLILLKAAQFIFVAGAAGLLIFFSPFARLQKIILLSGYYFIFEYAALARNYMPAIFFAFSIAVIYYREFRYKKTLYYLLLLLLSNVHLLGLLLAISIHAGFCYEEFRDKRKIGIHLLVGILLFLPAFYFILPPTDSQLNFQFWKEQWSVSRLYLFVTVIVKSLFPLQEWFNRHWWNTSFLLDNNSIFFRVISFVVFIWLIILIYIGARKSKIAIVILGINLLFTLLLSLVFPLNTARYVGFVLISIIVAAWISNRDPEHSFNKNIFMFFLLLQVGPGVFAVTMDSKQKFSSAQAVVMMNQQIPKGVLVATDYWCLNNLSAYLDSAFYCIELKRSISFLTWNSEMKAVMDFKYADALDDLLTVNHDEPFYFYSMLPVNRIMDGSVSSGHIHLLIAGDSGMSVEKSGQVYLYRVERQ